MKRTSGSRSSVSSSTNGSTDGPRRSKRVATQSMVHSLQHRGGLQVLNGTRELRSRSSLSVSYRSGDENANSGAVMRRENTIENDENRQIPRNNGLNSEVQLDSRRRRAANSHSQSEIISGRPTRSSNYPGPNGIQNVIIGIARVGNVVPNSNGLDMASLNRIIVPDKFLLQNHSPEIPESCSEALQGKLKGTMIVTPSLRGVPNRKYSMDDIDYSSEVCDWLLQAIIKDEKNYYAQYEGWSGDTIEKQRIVELRITAKELLKSTHERSAFYKVLKTRKAGEFRSFTRKIRESLNEADFRFEYPNITALMESPNASYWIFEDLTFFHTRILTEAGEAAVFYMEGYSTSVTTEFPDYFMITNNLLTNEVAEHLKAQKFSRNIDKLIEESTGEAVPRLRRTTACPSPSCKCDRRFDILFEEAQQLFYNAEGRLILDYFQNKEKNIIIECSDACGCDSSCPNRQVQNGSKKTLAVVTEKDKGFGLRAVKRFRKGEFVVEYKGKVLWGDKDTGDCSYEILFNTFGNYRIDAREYGNVSRFPNHSCMPNMAFLEVFTRIDETTVGVPRIGLFATKDIGAGEELTINYYPNSQATIEDGVKCECKTKRCRKFLPQ